MRASPDVRLKGDGATPRKRSPILIIAYGALIAAIVNLFLRAGMIWTATAAGIAVVLGVVEIVLQVRSRGASA